MNYTIKVLRIKKRIQQLLVVLILGVFYQAPAQTDVITGLENPVNIAIHGDDMYVMVGPYGAPKIVKIDLTETPPVAVDFISGFGITAGGLVLYNDALYLAVSREVKKISLLDGNNPSPTTVYVASQSLRTIGIYADKLYAALYFKGDIDVVDLTETPPVAVSTITYALQTPPGRFIAVNATNLYVRTLSKMYDVDLTTNPPSTSIFLSGFSGDFDNGIMLFNDELYVAGYGSVKKYNLTDPATNYTVVSGLNGPKGLAVYKGELYIAEVGANKISKISLAVLSVDTAKRTPKLLYPNPSSNYLQVAGLHTKQAFTIYNILGMQVQKGVILPEKKIDVSGLSKGVYSIQFGNNNGLQFIKE